jgi:hypothetical protein
MDDADREYDEIEQQQQLPKMTDGDDVSKEDEVAMVEA